VECRCRVGGVGIGVSSDAASRDAQPAAGLEIGPYDRGDPAARETLVYAHAALAVLHGAELTGSLAEAAELLVVGTGTAAG
jgi:hypothetical protein